MYSYVPDFARRELLRTVSLAVDKSQSTMVDVIALPAERVFIRVPAGQDGHIHV